MTDAEFDHISLKVIAAAIPRMKETYCERISCINILLEIQDVPKEKRCAFSHCIQEGCVCLTEQEAGAIASILILATARCVRRKKNPVTISELAIKSTSLPKSNFSHTKRS